MVSDNLIKNSCQQDTLIQLNKAIIADPKMGKYPKAGNTKNMINIFEKITDEKNRIANGLRTEKRTPKDEFIR